MNIIAEETTTLPEGAVLSVCRVKPSRGPVHLVLFALRGNKRVEMRLNESTSVASLPTLLKLIRRELERRRATMTKKPELDIPYRTPRTIQDFVISMAFKDMFVFHDFNSTSPDI
jgi:hypothetical protein